MNVKTTATSILLLLLLSAVALAQATPKEQPKAEQPKAEQPKAEQPKAEQPKAEQPKAEMEETKPDITMPPAVTEANVTTTTTTIEDPPRILVGLGIGAYFPTSDLGPNVVFALDATYQLPVLQGKLGVGLGLAYSQPTTSGTIDDSRVPDGAASYDSIMRELTLDLRVSYRFLSWSSVWSPHVAIGPIMYLLSHEVDSLQHEQTETSTQGGFIAVIGADYRLWKGALVGEVRIPFATVGQKTTGDSNVGAVAVTIGYRFRF